jgi:hypothetical protein
MPHIAARWRATMAALLVAVQLAQWSVPLSALAQAARPPVERGQEYYEQSRFDEAITLLKDLVDRGALQGTELTKAQELLARSYVKKGYPVQAKEMFKSLLRSTPTWRPDPIRVPPDEMAVFDQALKEYQESPAAPTQAPTTPAQPPATTPAKPATPSQIGVAKEGGKKKGLPWLWIGLGAVAVGGIAAVAAGGGGDDDGGPSALPGFPGTP